MSEVTLDPRKRVRVAPGVYERAGKYEIAWTLAGRTHWRTLPVGTTLTEAKKARKAEEVDTDRGEAVAPSKVKLSAVWDDYRASLEGRVLSGEMSENSVRLYAQLWKSHISPTLGDRRVQAITATDIARLLEALRRKGLSPWTVRSIYRVLSSILNHAITRGQLVQSPIVRLARSERPKARNVTQARVLTPEEIGRLVKSASDAYRDAIHVQALTGARVSELLGLVYGDIDREENVIRVRYQLERNGRPRRVRLKTEHSSRDIYLTPELDRLLAARRLAAPARHSGDDAFVFAAESGAALQQRNYSRALRKAAKRAGLNGEGAPPISTHDLRHSAISRWIAMTNLDVLTIARQAGDTVQTILRDYAHDFDERKRRAENVSQLAGAGIARVAP